MIYFKSTNKLNSPEYLLHSPNINVYTDAITKEYDGLEISLLPWINEENQDDVQEYLETTTAPICMSHLEVNGGEVSPGHFH